MRRKTTRSTLLTEVESGFRMKMEMRRKEVNQTLTMGEWLGTAADMEWSPVLKAVVVTPLFCGLPDEEPLIWPVG